ncbi:ribosome assembly protein 3 [Ophiostoma piceae UAMH 11346]|uniref:Ribosome assembly protein 3 n=1 Tax=Ophiostoma piceae (strain UAMH 11346) TaxID=1262450 RepID=S3BPY7_OPHP1|nr:ribosome assembly protein 3 [Ophiostoma piceae UAMH 11346]
MSASTNEAFQAYYLQRMTTELTEDLVQLRTAADFVVPEDVGAAASKKTASKPGVTAEDNSLQMLIGALRQGTSMFSPADQARVAGQ